jgi:catechol 2,3-dioxygenase-like lactoylglutathione lyase family enzyme
METIGIHHVAINVHDLDEALAFYVEQLEFTKLDRPAFDFPGAWVQAGASQIHLMETDEATIDRRQHVALQVRDLDAVLEALEAAGVEAARVPYVTGAGRQAFLRDPSGNRIELNQPDAG